VKSDKFGDAGPPERAREQHNSDTSDGLRHERAIVRPGLRAERGSLGRKSSPEGRPGAGLVGRFVRDPLVPRCGALFRSCRVGTASRDPAPEAWAPRCSRDGRRRTCTRRGADANTYQHFGRSIVHTRWSRCGAGPDVRVTRVSSV
jgi:hypothetical protein